MNDEDTNKLVSRVEELEKSNKALWAWVKQLAGQDFILLKYSKSLINSDDDQTQLADRIADSITENLYELIKQTSEEANE